MPVQYRFTASITLSPVSRPSGRPQAGFQAPVSCGEAARRCRNRQYSGGAQNARPARPRTRYPRYRLLPHNALKGLVRLDLQTVGIENKRIACDAGRFLIGLAEAAVDDKQLPAGLYGAFALLGLDGGMAVNYMSVSGSRPNSDRIMPTTFSSSQKLK